MDEIERLRIEVEHTRNFHDQEMALRRKVEQRLERAERDVAYWKSMAKCAEEDINELRADNDELERENGKLHARLSTPIPNRVANAIRAIMGK